MTSLYITADKVGGWTGGSQVTFHESEALKELGPCEICGREQLEQAPTLTEEEPWGWDSEAYGRLFLTGRSEWPKLVHFYAGTFSQTVSQLKQRGCKVTYTAAAHSIEESRKAHEDLGISFQYPHLTDPQLWERYVRGYLAADCLVVPSTHSESVMRSFGAKGRIEIIPHGVVVPEGSTPPPGQFRVGYLGAVGPDKGLKYLLQAWKKLNYKDATLVIAGRDSQSDFVRQLCHVYGGGMIELKGWVDKVEDFYNNISLYVQPSVTEGFGIEVLEAYAHGRMVLCSTGAGAVDVVPTNARFQAKDVNDLAGAIDYWYARKDLLKYNRTMFQDRARDYEWSKIRLMYQQLWKELLA